MHEGAVPGDRLNYLLPRLVTARATLAPIPARLRATGRLSNITDDEFLLLLLMAGMVPFGMPALTQGLLGQPLSPQRHAQILVEALLGPQQPATEPVGLTAHEDVEPSRRKTSAPGSG